MAGCFGNSDYDRYLEREVDEYLSRYDEEDQQTYVDYKCSECGEEFSSVYEDDNEGICPHCGHDNWEE